MRRNFRATIGLGALFAAVLVAAATAAESVRQRPLQVGWADLAAAEVKGTVVSGYKTHSGNWFTDSAGTTALGALPGTNDKFYWNNTALNGKEIVIPNGTAASVYTLELGTEDDSVLK